MKFSPSTLRQRYKNIGLDFCQYVPFINLNFIRKIDLQENTCARVSFLIKLQDSGLRPATLLKKRLWYRCFPVNSKKFAS